MGKAPEGVGEHDRQSYQLNTTVLGVVYDFDFPLAFGGIKALPKLCDRETGWDAEPLDGVCLSDHCYPFGGMCSKSVCTFCRCCMSRSK